MRRLSTTTIGMMAWSKRVCVLLVVSLLFDLSVCLCRPECLSVTGLRLTYSTESSQYCTCTYSTAVQYSTVLYCTYHVGITSRVEVHLRRLRFIY